MLASHDDFSKASEKVSLKWFREEIREHLFGGAVLDRKTVRLKSVFDKEVVNVNMLRARAARLSSVLFELDRAFIILRENVADDCVYYPCLSVNFRVQIAYGR